MDKAEQVGQTVVGLVQISNSFFNQSYLPYSVAVLEAYARQQLSNSSRYYFLAPIYKRLSVEEAVKRLIAADVVAFSTYVWNIRLSLRIAHVLKQKKPRIINVFGGPQIPNNAEEFLRKYPFIDLVCHGEGEGTFVSILENVGTKDWRVVPSVSYLKDSLLVQNCRAQRIDLSKTPSPYLDGLFNELIRANPEEQWIALWETNRGCPYRCSFCEWGSAFVNKIDVRNFEQLCQEIDWFAAQKIEFVCCADANFGILPRDLELARYFAQSKKKCGYPQAFSVQDAKNTTERSYQIQKVLSDNGLNRGAVISVQSLDPNVLKAVRRENIKLGSFRELQRRYTQNGIAAMTDLILGLPNETYESFADGVSSLIENGQHNRIQFNNLSILPNAEMGDPQYRELYGMNTVQSRIINVHGAQAEIEDDVPEMQELVISTASMPPTDWVRARAFSWVVGLLHFDKLLQIPLVVAHELTKISYRELIELFSEGWFLFLPGDFPILSEIREFFLKKARDIQKGGEEYCYCSDWLGIWWMADEFVFIKLFIEGKLSSFYKEAKEALELFLQIRFCELPPGLLSEAIQLNSLLLKAPFQTQDFEIVLSCNIWEMYQGALRGEVIPLRNKLCRYRIDRTTNQWQSWDRWFQEVVWYGNKRGAYLYDSVQEINPAAS